MVNMSSRYVGQKQCVITHESGTTITSDAPKDIGGSGSSFSPTDLVGAALMSCILTTVAMWGERHELDLTGMEAAVQKVMRTETPRRIASLRTTLTIPGTVVPEEMRQRLEHVATSCPVHKSLHPEIDALVTFQYV